MSQGEPWRATLDGVVVTCRLTPKGGRDAIDGVAERPDGTRVLLVRVREPPEGGRANGALWAAARAKARNALIKQTVRKLAEVGLEEAREQAA